MRTLIFDPFAGISGDMILGALVDLGLAEDWLQGFVDSLDLGEIEVRVERVERCGIACPHVSFDLPEEHAHRHLRHILEIVERAPVSDEVREKAAAVFRRLADAEARVHGIAPEQVHFHEVGALDAILDVLCALAGIEELGYRQFRTRPVAVGHGWIDIAHGRFPVPAPATVGLLQGFEVTGTELEGECSTPTGAALLAVLTEGQAPAGSFTIGRAGYGAGTRDSKERPNCLRVLEAEIGTGTADDLFVVQTDVDDLAPEYAPPALEALFRAGALDATITPLQMKKGRPGMRLEALTPAGMLQEVLEAMFRNTSTIGARFWPVLRPALPRQEETLTWRGHEIRAKRVTLPGGAERVKPEFEDVARAAEAEGVAPLDVLREIGRPGAT